MHDVYLIWNVAHIEDLLLESWQGCWDVLWAAGCVGDRHTAQSGCQSGRAENQAPGIEQKSASSC
jgi:hypothetical protein